MLTINETLPVKQERSKTTGVEMVQYCNEKMVIEFKGIGKLRCDLINTVNKLKEYW